MIFGGRSGEHEVSLASAASVLAAIDTTRYDVIPMGIARDGQWLVGGDPLRALAEAAGVPLALPRGVPAAGPEARPGARARGDGRRAAGRDGREPGRRVPRAPRPVRRGRHAPGPSRAGRRPLRGRRRHGLGRRDGQGDHEGRVPGARPPGRPAPRRPGPRVAAGPGASAAAGRRRARLPLLRQARQPRLERRHLQGPAERALDAAVATAFAHDRKIAGRARRRWRGRSR